MEARTTPAARNKPNPQHMLTKLVRYPRSAKGQTSAAYAVDRVSGTLDYTDRLDRLLLTEDSPRNAADQLSGEQHRKRGREDGDEDGATHANHCTAIDTFRSISSLGETVDEQSNNLPNAGGIVDSSLPIGRNEKLSFRSDTSKTLEKRGLAIKRVDLVA